MVAQATSRKPVVIMLDMAKGYGWKPGSFGYEMVARVRRLKDAAHAAGVQVSMCTACAGRRIMCRTLA